MKLFVYLLAVAAMAMAEETSSQALLRAGNDRFTSEFFTEVTKQHPEESVVLSGYSVLPILAQLGLAGVGATHDEILKTIGLPNDNVTKIVFSEASSQLRSVKGVTLKMASKLYIPPGSKLNEQFLSVSRDVFESEVQQIDFSKATEAAAEINAWVEDHTNKRIKDLVDPQALGPDTRTVAVNAIYFKGLWKNPFKKVATRDRDFHVSKDKVIQVPTMYQTDDFRYGESTELNAKLLEMFYEGGESSLLIVLPNEVDGIKSLQEKLQNPKALAEAEDKMYTAEVEVFMPKFKIETTTNLKIALMAMGVKKIFTPKAQLNNLLEGESSMYVTDAIQKAFIEVNEEGAEAAAANEFGISYLSAFIGERRVFEANHPFIFILRENENTLFTGIYRT